MADERLLDVYEAAFLAGGPDRVVETALVALVETGRVRVQRGGQLSVVDDRSRHPVEDAVLAAIGPHGHREFETVRWMAGKDERLTGLTERLRRDGLISGIPLPWWRRPVVLTAAGRRTLRRLRADPAVTSAAAGTSAATVALNGTEQMPDREQRDALFNPPGPHRQRGHSRRRRGAGQSTAGGDGAKYWAAGGAAGFVGCGADSGGAHGGGHGCGGHGRGGGSGGGGGGGRGRPPPTRPGGPRGGGGGAAPPWPIHTGIGVPGGRWLGEEPRGSPPG